MFKSNDDICRRLDRERNRMKTGHWLSIAIVFVIAYLVGVKFPSIGSSLLSKVGM